MRLDGPAMAYCIRRCCELKAEVVAADEREAGLRALLNLDIPLATPLKRKWDMAIGYMVKPLPQV